MGGLETAFSSIQEGAIGRDVMEPVGAIVPPNFAMPSGNETARVRQRPIQIGIAPNVQTALALDRDAERPAVGQAGLIFDMQRQRHIRLAEAHGMAATLNSPCQRPIGFRSGAGSSSSPMDIVDPLCSY